VKGELWVKAFERHQRLAAARERFPKKDPEDACGCIKPTGAWGDQGWHHRHWTAADARRKLREQGDGNEREPTDAEVARFLATYTQPVAYERCPAYVRAVQRNREYDALLSATEAS
jgi:hypothetical protein